MNREFYIAAWIFSVAAVGRRPAAGGLLPFWSCAKLMENFSTPIFCLEFQDIPPTATFYYDELRLAVGVTSVCAFDGSMHLSDALDGCLSHVVAKGRERVPWDDNSLCSQRRTSMYDG